MIEIIKLLVDGLMKAVPILVRSRDQQKLKRIGAMLFLIYFRLNEILVVAGAIVSSLETYAQRMERHIATGDDAYALTAGNWISEKISKQQINLARVKALIRESRIELVLIEPDSYVNLVPLLDAKVGALTQLTRAMEHGTLMLSISSKQLGYLQSQMDAPLQDYSQTTANDAFSREYVNSQYVRTNERWDEAVYTVVRDYLDNRDPRIELAEIRNSIARLRAALLSHFAIEDMLLAAGDERFDEPF